MDRKVFVYTEIAELCHLFDKLRGECTAGYSEGALSLSRERIVSKKWRQFGMPDRSLCLLAGA
jgi:hypothetical protein